MIPTRRAIAPNRGHATYAAVGWGVKLALTTLLDKRSVARYRAEVQLASDRCGFVPRMPDRRQTPPGFPLHSEFDLKKDSSPL